MGWVEFIPLASAPTSGKIKLQWSAATVAATIRVKVIPVETRFDNTPENTHKPAVQDVNSDTTLDFALTTEGDGSLVCLVALVTPATAAGIYTVTPSGSAFGNKDIIYSGLRPQMTLWVAKNVANPTVLDGSVTVNGAPAGTAGQVYVFEIPEVPI